jgi:fructuronate reductase
VATAPARLVAGLAARRLADAGPISLVPCDNLPSNGDAVARLVLEMAGLVDPTLPEWLARSATFVSSVVDRITPRTTPEDVRALAAATGVDDASPVITEPFSEWVLSGELGTPRWPWEDVGVRFADDIASFEQRKLWLLNGGHSLLAYVGSIRGATTVAEAVEDDGTRAGLELWWSEASRQLALPDIEVADYRAALVARFANRRIRHQLDQIAADGSQKLPVRVLPTLRAERAAGRLPEGAATILAGWLCHLRGHGVPVTDPRERELRTLASGPSARAARQVITWLDPALGADDSLVDCVRGLADRLVA